MPTTEPAGPPPYPALTPFVGRADEVAVLHAALARTLAGRGALVLVAGDPGMGKTRLAEEFARYAEAQGAHVLWGRCYEGAGAPAYWPWLQVLRTYVRGLDDTTLQRELGAGAPFVAQLLPELHARLPDLPEPPALEPSAARFHLFDALTGFLTAAARRRPLLIVLDDLHWADAASLLWLHFLTQAVRDQPLLLLGAFRDVEITPAHSLADALVELTRELHTARLTLSGFSPVDVGRFVEHLAGSHVSDRLAETLHVETGGNPFFLGEVVRMLAAEGQLTDSLQIPLRHIPDSVREVIRRRLDRLPPACLDLLSLASVAGRTFSGRLLASARQAHLTDALDQLDAAVAARIIEPYGPLGHYQFSHALIQETLYAGLGTAQRMQLHQEIGTALEERYRGDPAPHFAELAYHYSQAAPLGAADKAVSYALEAAEYANGQVAWETAIVHYQLALGALELLEPRNEQLRCDVLLALGEAHNRAGTDAGLTIGAGISAGAVSTFMEAARVARAAGLAEHFARAAYGIVGLSLSVAQGFNEASALMRDALATMPDTDRALRARLMAGYAAHRSALMAIGKEPLEAAVVAETEAITDEAVAMARRLGDPATLSYALHARCHIHLGPDDLDRCLADAEEALATADVAEDARLRVLALFDVHQVALFRGDNAGARNILVALRRAAEPLRVRYFDYVVGICEAGQAMRDGRLTDAELQIEFALSSWPRGGIASGELLAVRREQERVAESADAARWILDQLPGVRMWEALWILTLLEGGRPDEACAHFAAIPDDALLHVSPHWKLRLCALYTEFCDALDDKRRAELLYDYLLPYARHNIFASNSDYVCGSASHYLGILATVLERWEDADRHFEAALDAHECWRYPLHAAYTRYAWADSLSRRGRAGDLPRISILVESASTAAAQLGSARLARLTERVAARVGLLRPSTQPAARPGMLLRLSRREREVLELIIEGHTDKEIADRLYISPRTVTTHVTHILNKLGVGSRGEAAELAAGNSRLTD